MAFMVRIFLIGYMGVGKTTIGRELAKKLNFEFVDLDHFIQNRYNKDITSIFEEEGEAKFREIENKTLREVATFENVVVSTGGGAPCFFDNMDIMNQSGLTIYLKATPELLTNRLITSNRDKRPLIKNKTEDELLQFISENIVKRDPFYSLAHLTFESDELVDKSEIDKYLSQLINKITKYTQNNEE